jgi:hypothetical protein
MSSADDEVILAVWQGKKICVLDFSIIGWLENEFTGFVLNYSIPKAARLSFGGLPPQLDLASTAVFP